MKFFKILLSTIILLFLVLAFSESHANSGGLKVGDKAPHFSAFNQDGNKILLQDLLSEGKVILIFYRGQWCPICNRHLKAVQDSIELLTKNGAFVVGVSPEKQEFLQKSSEMSGATYPLLYDRDYAITKAYKGLYKPDEEEIESYHSLLDTNFQVAHDNDEVFLPVPATYIIDSSGEIIFVHYDRNYRHRASIREMLPYLTDN